MSNPKENQSLAKAELLTTLDQALSKRGEDRLEVLLDSPNPKAVMAHMALPEAFFSFAELSEESRRSFLKLISQDQLDYLLDLDLWQSDRVDPDKALIWLERLWGAQDELAAQWLMSAQSELIVSILKKLMTVTEGPPPSQVSFTEAQDQLPPFSAEGKYFISFHSERAAALLRGPLILVASHNIEYYLALLQEVLSTLASDTEETAYKTRWNRLRDEGFLPPDEAYSVYAWPRSDELEDQEDQSQYEDLPDSSTPTALALCEPGGLLEQALVKLDDSHRDQVARSFAVTGSLVLSADHLSFSDIDDHRRALKKTLGYVNIGLHRIAKNDPSDASVILTEQGVRRLFRVGYAEVAALGRKAYTLKNQGWLSQINLGIEVLDEPLADIVRALAQSRPLFPAVAFGSEGRDREFLDHTEVQRCDEALEQVEALKRLFIDGLGLDLAPAQSFDLKNCYPPDPAELTLGLILKTAIAQLLLNDQLRFSPVLDSELPVLTRKISKIERAPFLAHVTTGLKERMLDPSSTDLGHISAFIENHCESLFDVFGSLDSESSIDPRFVGTVVIRHSYRG